MSPRPVIAPRQAALLVPAGAALRLPILRRSIALWAATLLGLAPLWPLDAAAERADRTKPLNYEADGGRADDKQGVVELKGNVVVSKGTLEIRADRIELRNTKQGQSATATGTPGAPARFRQKREGVDEYMEGQAQQIDYDVRKETVRFSQQAVLRRVRAGVVTDEISGQTITYDNLAEAFEVLGSTTTPVAVPASAPAARVRGVLAPRDEAPEKPGSGGDRR